MPPAVPHQPSSAAPPPDRKSKLELLKAFLNDKIKVEQVADLYAAHDNAAGLSSFDLAHDDMKDRLEQLKEDVEAELNGVAFSTSRFI